MQGSDLTERLRVGIVAVPVFGSGGLHTPDFRSTVALMSEAASEIERLEAERDEARRIIAACAAALPNGAFIDAERASLTFMAQLPGEIAAVCAAAEAHRDQLAALVEQAFRDGLAYASNVVVTDPDLAWGHSKVRAALSLLEQKP